MWTRQHVALGYSAETKETRVLTIYIDAQANYVIEIQQDSNGEIIKCEIDAV
jgi:hypothetical protein